MHQITLAALNDVCPLAYVNIFQSGLSKVNAGPPEVPYWNTLLDTCHPVSTDCCFKVIYKIPSKYSVNIRFSVLCIAEALTIHTFKPDLCCQKEIYCFSFSTMDLDIIVIVIIIYLFIFKPDIVYILLIYLFTLNLHSNFNPHNYLIN